MTVPTSIVIPCHGEAEYTRLCVEKILRFTTSPCELLMVDNASAGDCDEVLESVRYQPRTSHVEVIRTESNLSYAAACNQGLARARGEYVVFLNNDTIVTEGWLEGLIAWAKHPSPPAPLPQGGRGENWSVGLVGPVTNYAPPPQKVEVDYTDIVGMHAFAARRQREFARRAVAVPRLSGFCLLARRDVLDQIGGFDERFGVGFFEDDDLCFRAADAGYRLLVALNVFVHHFGSRTFKAQNIDTEALLRANFEKFKEKWGPERTAGYRPFWEGTGRDAGQTAPAPLLSSESALGSTDSNVRHSTVSLCMIVKNEEANLAACLESVRDLVDEIIILDTGSTDKTRQVAEQFRARVHDFPWIDSFAAARNESIRHATGEWVFWLDADDRLDEENRTRLRSLFASLKDENAAYVMKCLCLPDPVSKTATVVDHVRLFRNHPNIRWRYRVHEQILPAIRQRNGEVRWSDVVIHHAGYQDPELRQTKLQRDLRLLQMDLPEHYDDPFILFNLGSVYQELGQANQAIPLLRRSLERSHPSDSIVRKLYALLCLTHRQLGQLPEALSACRAGRRVYPDDIELLFHEAILRHAQGDLAGAEGCLLQLLQSKPGEHFASVDTGLRGYKAHHNLAIVYRDQGQSAEAESHWRAAVENEPTFVPAWLGLGELAISQSRWDDAEGIACGLQDDLQCPLDAATLRGRSLLARKDFLAAQQLLRVTAERFPQALLPRILLSYAYLQEGRDWPAAEQALRDVLALDPDQAEARRNLALLLQEINRNGAEPG